MNEIMSYSQNYKERMNAYFNKQKKQEFRQKQVQKEINPPKAIPAETKIEYPKIPDTENKKNTPLFKIIVWIIPLLIILYLVYSNFLVSREFNYFYDIGSEEDSKKPYLSPLSRVSEAFASETGYRNLTESLVYFNAPVVRGSDQVDIEIRFKDNSLEDSIVSLGAKDQEFWHYKFNTIYNPGLNELKTFDNFDNVYRINKQAELVDIINLETLSNIVIATDKEFKKTPNKINGYNHETTLISSALRGGHKFYIYTQGDLNLEIKKRDLNWYEGSDEVELSLYNSYDVLLANSSIEDDGITNVSKKEAEVQSGKLSASSLASGVYKIEISDFDGIITEIKINTNKIVFERLFLADNSAYGIKTKMNKVYLNSNKNYSLSIMTYHESAFQDIIYSHSNQLKIFNLSKRANPMQLNMNKGEYVITFPKNDVIIDYPGYFAFSKDNYFEPFMQTVIPIPSNLTQLKNNVDYIYTDYHVPEKNDSWVIAKTSFNIKEDSLYVKDNKLSLVINAPSLSKEDSNSTIPIDWIKIKVYKPGLFG